MTSRSSLYGLWSVMMSFGLLRFFYFYCNCVSPGQHLLTTGVRSYSLCLLLLYWNIILIWELYMYSLLLAIGHRLIEGPTFFSSSISHICRLIIRPDEYVLTSKHLYLLHPVLLKRLKSLWMLQCPPFLCLNYVYTVSQPLRDCSLYVPCLE